MQKISCDLLIVLVIASFLHSVCTSPFCIESKGWKNTEDFELDFSDEIAKPHREYGATSTMAVGTFWKILSPKWLDILI